MSRPLATGIDPLSVAAREQHVDRLAKAARRWLEAEGDHVCVCSRCDSDEEIAAFMRQAGREDAAVEEVESALAPFEGKGKEAGDES